MTIHGEAVLLRYSFLQILCQLQAVQIRHTAALGTDKVGMGVGVPVKPFLTVDHAYTFDGSLFLKEQQVPVDGAQTQVGMLWLQGLVQPFRRGVAVGILNGLKERFSFFAVSNCFCHYALIFFLFLLTIIIIVYDMIIAYTSLFVKRKIVDF